ncbi:MAG: haloacid dehalogenase-like hydrolase [Bacteroidota bacterium]
MNILEHPNLRRFFSYLDTNADSSPVIFDCDGTIIKGDVGESMLYYQIEHFLFRRSPADIWADFPDRKVLSGLFQSLERVPAEERDTHPSFPPFADAILDWYFGQIDAGQVAKACTDIVRLFSGYTTSEVRTIAAESFAGELGAAVGMRTLGRRTLPRGIRYIHESLELLRALIGRNVELWVVSGSSKWSVEPVFEPLGIPAGQVIGIELVEEDGRLTDTGVTPVPIREEKVAAFRRHSSRTPILVASDSRNDIPLFRIASRLKVRINSRGRSSKEFFDDIGEHPNGSWVNVEKPTILAQGEQDA